MKQFFTFFFTAAMLLLSAATYSQVTVTSSDTLSCTNLCTTLTAHVIGDVPINSGITDDDVFAPIPNPIGFNFYFYGIPYYSCLIGPNGNVSFDTADAGMSTDWEITGPLLGNPTVYNTICGPWEDIFIPAGGTITYSTDGIAPNRKYVITYCHTAMFSCTTQYTTTQIILYETSNIVEIHLTHKDICTGWNPSGGTDGGRAIIGVQNATGTDATAAPGRDWMPVWSATDEAWRFSPYITAAGAVSYTVAPIPYAPIPYDSSSIYWYNTGTGAYLGTGSTLVVCPTTTTGYKAGSLGCADTSYGYYTVSPTAALIAAIASTSNPTKCGACDGNIVINGLTPGTIDTINYDYAGVPQPTVIAVASTGGTIILTGLCAGSYTNIIARQATCSSAPLSATLANPGISISGYSSLPVTDSCNARNGSLILDGLYPGQLFTVSYTFNGLAQPPVTATSNSAGVIIIPLLPKGAYDNIVASFPTGCTTPAVGPDTIQGPPPTDIFLTSFTNPTQCGYFDGSISINYISPYSADTVFWSLNGVVQIPFLNIAGPTGTIYIPGLGVGDYSDMTIKVGPCPSTVIGEAVLTAPPIIDSFSYVNHFGCNGDTVMFTNKSSSSGPLYYVWNYGDSTFTDTATNPQHIFRQGVYNITLTADNHVCDTTFTLSDSLLHPLQASFVDTPFIYCQNTPVTLTNTSSSPGIISYEWLFGDGNTDTAANTVHTYPKAGTYNVQLVATNFIPCHDTASLLVSIDSSTAIALNVTDSVICRSSSITFTGDYTTIGNTGITWSFGDGDTAANVNPVLHSYDVAGTYTVTATPHYRVCRDTSISKQFTIFAAPTIYLGPDTSICAGSEAITLTDYTNANTKGATWLWSNGATTPGITVVSPGYYAATVDINGCYSTDTVWVTNDCFMEIPNVFSPNGDGLNDYFYPLQELAKGLTSFKIDIYNRWGQLVFEGTALDGRGWDGKFNGVDQPEGVYIYIIDATFVDGQKQHHQGNLTLLR